MACYSTFGSNRITPDSTGHPSQTCRSVFEFHEGTNPAVSLSRSNHLTFEFASGPVVTAFEHFNNFATQYSAATGSAGTQNIKFYVVVNDVSFAAWRGDYRRNVIIHSDGGTGYGQQYVGTTNAFIWFEEAWCVPWQLPIRRYLRRAREAQWFFTDSQCCVHKKTGSGAYELTSVPHMINDGLTWIDASAWQLGHSQSLVAMLTAPQVYTQLFTALLGIASDFIYPWRQGSFLTFAETAINVQGLLGWWKADAQTLTNGTGITNWPDSSGNGRALTCLSGTPPTYVTNVINGKPVFRFNTTSGDNRLYGPDLMPFVPNSGQNFTVFAVAFQPSAKTSGLDVCHAEVSGGGFGFNYLATTGGVTMGQGNDSTDHSGAFHVFSAVANSGTITAFLDGVNITANLSNNFCGNVGQVMLGSGVTAGDIAELAYYAGTLSDSDRQTIENYLAAKYALGFGTPPPGPQLFKKILGTAKAAALSFLGGAQVTDDSWGTSFATTSANALRNPGGQAFTSKGGKLIGAAFYAYFGAPVSGPCYAKLYSLTGTYGVNAIPNTLLATSDPEDVTPYVGATPFVIPFSFSGSNQYQMSAGGQYAIIFDTASVAGAGVCFVYGDNVAPVHSGNDIYTVSGPTDWHADPSSSTIFYVYTQNPSLLKLTNKIQAASASFAGVFRKSIQPIKAATLSFVGATTLKTSRTLAAVLSFIGSFTKGKFSARTLTATLSFIGAFARAQGKIYTATLSFIGALPRKIFSGQSGILSFVGAIAKRLARTLSAATLSFVGAFAKQLGRSLTGTLSFIGAISRRTGKALTAALSFAGATANRTIRTLTAALSFVGSIAKQANKALTAILSFIGSIATVYIPGGVLHLLTVTGTLSFVGSLAKLTQRILAATLSFVGAIQRRIAKAMTATLNFIVGVFIFGDNAHLAAALNFVGSLSLLKSLHQIYTAALSFVGNVFKQVATLRTAVLSFIGTFLTGKSLHQTLTAVLSFIGSLTLAKTLHQVYTATLSFVGNILKQTRAIKAATLSFAGVITLLKSLHQTLAAALSFIGSLNVTKLLHQTYAATLSFIGSLVFTRMLHQALAATLSFIGSLALIKTLGRIFTATLSFVGIFSKNVSRSLTAILSFVGALLRQLPSDLAATLSFIGSISKRTGTLRTAILSFIGTISRLQGKVFAGAVSFVGAFAKLPQKLLTGVLSFIGALPKFIRSGQAAILNFLGVLNISLAGHIFQTLTATLNFSGALSRAIKSHYTAALSFLGQLGRQIPQRLSAVLSFIGTLFSAKMLQRVLTAALNFSGALIKRTGKLATAVLSFVGAINLQTRRSLAAALSFAGVIAKQLNRQLGAVLSFIGSFTSVKLLLRLLIGTLSFSGAISRRIAKLMTAVLSFVGQFLRRIPVDLSAVLSFIGALPKQTRKLLQAALLSFHGALTAFGEKFALFQAHLTFSGAFTKQVSKVFSAILNFIGLIPRGIPVAFQATLNFIGAFFTNLPTNYQVALSAILSFSGELAQKSVAVLKIFVGTIVQVLKIRALADLLGLNIDVSPPAPINLGIAVPEDPLEINVPLSDNPTEIKIQERGNLD